MLMAAVVESNADLDFGEGGPKVGKEADSVSFTLGSEKKEISGWWESNVWSASSQDLVLG